MEWKQHVVKYALRGSDHTYELHIESEQSVSIIRFTHPPAHMRVRQILTPLQVLTLLVGFQQHQSVLVKKNHFFVLVLGFDAVASSHVIGSHP